MALLALPLACSATGTTQRGTDGGASASDGDGGSGGTGTGTTGGTGTGTTGGTGTGTTGGTGTGTTGGTGTGTTGGTGTGTTGGTGTGTTGGTTGTTGGTGNGTTGGTGGTPTGTGGNGTVDPGDYDTVLIDGSATWKYFDSKSDLEADPVPSGWQEVGFDDSGWDTGQASLGYNNDTVTEICCRPFTGGKDDDGKVIRPPAVPMELDYHFRHSFTVDDASRITGVHIQYQRDDGIIIYLNGTEVDRDNVPDWIDKNTPSDTVGGSDETNWFSAIDDTPSVGLSPTEIADLLVDGNNVVSAVVYQIHRDGTSSDVTFNLQLAVATE